jgi:hypothetical protein
MYYGLGLISNSHQLLLMFVRVPKNSSPEDCFYAPKFVPLPNGTDTSALSFLDLMVVECLQISDIVLFICISASNRILK